MKSNQFGSSPSMRSSACTTHWQPSLPSSFCYTFRRHSSLDCSYTLLGEFPWASPQQIFCNEMIGQVNLVTRPRCSIWSRSTALNNFQFSCCCKSRPKRPRFVVRNLVLRRGTRVTRVSFWTRPIVALPSVGIAESLEYTSSIFVLPGSHSK